MDEHAEHSEGFLDILLDPSHMAAEIVSHLAIELVLLLIIIPLWRLYHARFDKNHGISHED